MPHVHERFMSGDFWAGPEIVSDDTPKLGSFGRAADLTNVVFVHSLDELNLDADTMFLTFTDESKELLVKALKQRGHEVPVTVSQRLVYTDRVVLQLDKAMGCVAKNVVLVVSGDERYNQYQVDERMLAAVTRATDLFIVCFTDLWKDTAVKHVMWSGYPMPNYDDNAPIAFPARKSGSDSTLVGNCFASI